MNSSYADVDPFRFVYWYRTKRHLAGHRPISFIRPMWWSQITLVVFDEREHLTSCR